MSKTVRFILIALAAGMLALLGVLFWVFQQLQPVNAADTTKKRFVIAKGQSVTKTASSLQEAGLVRNATVFKYYARYKNLDQKMQAGSYQLSADMTVSQLATALTEGTEDVWITLLEGWRTEEVAEYLAAQELEQFDKDAFITMASNSEGMIFPDTYLVPRESTAEQLYDLFIATFERKVVSDLAAEIQASGQDIKEVITLASIVEREGRGVTDMRHVAGILQNRLDINMALQADATLQYIRGFDQKNSDWWSPPDVVFKESTSPYNTYKYPGLPPGPISNPGIQAIKAVLDPIESNDLFYIHAPSGEAYYAETLDAHNANINRYLR